MGKLLNAHLQFRDAQARGELFDDEDEDEDYDEDEDDSSIGKRVLNILKGIFIVILVLALLFVALRLLEGQGIVRLTGLRGVINSISPEAAEWLLPEPEAQQDSGSDDLPSLDNDGFDNSFTDDSANFGPVDGTDTTGVDAGAAAGGNLFPTASPTVAPTSAPTATPTAAPTEVPFDDSQLSAILQIGSICATYIGFVKSQMCPPACRWAHCALTNLRLGQRICPAFCPKKRNCRNILARARWAFPYRRCQK